MNLQRRKKVIALLSILLFALSLALICFNSSTFSSIENKSWDWRASAVAGSRKKDPRVRIITIDQRSLDYYAKEESITWPWPRALYVPVIEFLKKAGAKAVAFDLLFTESSVHGVSDDKDLAVSMKGTMPVINAAVITNGELTKPVSEITDVAKYGLVNATPDTDGIFRRTKPFLNFQNQSLLTLPFALADAAGLQSDRYQSLQTDQGHLVVNFRGPSHEYPEENIVSIISSYVALTEGKEPTVSLDSYKDSLVFIGVSAPGLMDLRPTSVDKIFRGVEFNATVLDNIINNDFITVAPLWWSFLLTAIFILVISYTLLFSQRALTQVLISLLGITTYFLVAYFFALYGYWILVALPLAILVFTIISSLGVQYQLEGRERRFIHQAFSHYVSPKVIDRILENPSQLSLGGDRRELTIHFSDIQGFTSVSEHMPPEQLVAFLNRYLSEMTDIILASGGTLDKYEGDAIIAFWNAPLAIEDHAYHGVKAAIDCQCRLSELREYFEKEFGVEVKVRIGMHTGHVTVGNFGSTNRFDYTIIGDAANLASRLEGVNKVFGTFILISETSFLACKNKIGARYIGKVQVIGRGAPVAVYEPFVRDDQFTNDQIVLFKEAMTLFESKNLEAAAKKFQMLTSDPVSKNYLARIEREKNIVNSDSWTSVWILDSK